MKTYPSPKAPSGSLLAFFAAAQICSIAACSTPPAGQTRSAVSANARNAPGTVLDSATILPTESPLRELPYTPALDPASIDRSIDPCVDLYAFSCGGWQKNNPIPADESKWSVYSKLGNEVQRHLWGLLLQASDASASRSPQSAQLGDYFAACMDEAGIEAKGAKPLAPAFASLETISDRAGLTAWLAKGALEGGGSLLFSVGSVQDADDSTRYIAVIDTRGLGLPDRDDYLAADAKSTALRERYRAYAEKMLMLVGEDSAKAREGAALVLRLETELAKATLSRVERRDPHKTFHGMSLGTLQGLAPAVDWKRYFEAASVTQTKRIDVSQPKLVARLSELFSAEPPEVWKHWLRFKLVDKAAHLLSSPFVDAKFEFRTKYLRGTPSNSPRWKRCVAYEGDDLSEAVGQLFVERNFSPDLKRRAEIVVGAIQKAMDKELDGLAWMSPATKKEARAKLGAMVDKIGYPEKFRDYSKVDTRRDDFYGNVARAWRFEQERELARIGKPIDRTEWEEPPQEVDAYYDPQKNDMNFPAAVLLPPLFDGRMDDAPNYGDTGACIGHELVHGFDDQGRKFDAKGNLRDWWTHADSAEFDKRAACISAQYSQYVAVDDVHVNGKLTLGEDLADLGGLILAYKAWTTAQSAERGRSDQPTRDGLTPAQRFFVGYAQWDCANIRPEAARLHARTDEHSPPRFRINGVVTNMPEFAQAFSCRAGQPMVKPTADVCSVW
jgi:endothelin-converting enzyme/putative endopeptidase